MRDVSLTVVGSIAYDAVTTPFGARERMLGGSAVHFSLAASFFTDVHVVGPVGNDFAEEDIKLLKDRGIDTSGIQRESGNTFFWRGRYEEDLNVAHTEETRLGVFADFQPELSETARNADTLFLGNIIPTLQQQVRAQVRAPRLAALDSMNHWIADERESLEKAIAEVDCLLLNDAEVRQLTGEWNLAVAAEKIIEMGPRAVVVKRGEYGSVLFGSGGRLALPGILLGEVKDPTGAGDSFAGGFLGYLDSHQSDADNFSAICRAMAYGTVIASFNVEDFGTERVSRLTRDEIEARLEELRGLITIDR